MFSSPAGMRHKMAIGKPPAGLQNYEIMPRPGMSRDRQLLQKSKVGRDIHSGAFQIPPPAQQPAAREAYAGGRPTLDRRVSIIKIWKMCTKNSHNMHANIYRNCYMQYALSCMCYAKVVHVYASRAIYALTFLKYILF